MHTAATWLASMNHIALFLSLTILHVRPQSLAVLKARLYGDS